MNNPVTQHNRGVETRWEEPRVEMSYYDKSSDIQTCITNYQIDQLLLFVFSLVIARK